jgi:hypothetical protein
MYTDTSTLPLRTDGDDAPTQLLGTPLVAAEAASTAAPVVRSTDTKGPIAVLLVVGSLLLATLLVAIVFIAFRGSAAPADEVVPPTADGPAIDIDDVAPPTTEVPPVVAPPEPVPTTPQIATFTSSNQTVLCNTQSPTPSPQYISFTWSVSNASRVYFGVDTTDASAAAVFDNLPLSGTSTFDFPAGYNDYTYNCPNASRTYTLTAVDEAGHKTSRSVVIVNEGDTV